MAGSAVGHAADGAAGRWASWPGSPGSRAGVVRLRRLRRAGRSCAGERRARRAAAHHRNAREHPLCGGLGQPVTFGFRRPVVLLPDSLRMQPEPIQRAVLAHELWHVRRRDWIWTVVEEAVRAVFWFHPAIWMLLSRDPVGRVKKSSTSSRFSRPARAAAMSTRCWRMQTRPRFSRRPRSRGAGTWFIGWF